MEEKAFKIKEQVLELSERAGANVHFLKARREMDIARFIIFGEKERVLTLPPVFEDIFSEQAIEIISAMYHSQDYTLTMVVTQKLEAHPLHMPERRNKLLRLYVNSDSKQMV